MRNLLVKQVILNIRAFCGDSSVSTWLYRITVNTVLEMLRVEKRYNGGALYDESIAADESEAFDHDRKTIRRAVKPMGARLKTAAIGPRSVSLKIYGGEMLLAGVPGAYDTIMIDAESHIVRAIGTKFSLRKRGDSLSVDIIEGAVEVAEKSFDSPFRLQEGLSALFLRGSNPAVMNMPTSRTDSLLGLFSEIADETCAGDEELLWNIKEVNRTDAIGDERSEKKAEAEIKHYLARYPNGVYRQPQLQYLIRIYQKRGQTEKACSLMREFVGEYPENSPARPGLL